MRDSGFHLLQPFSILFFFFFFVFGIYTLFGLFIHGSFLEKGGGSFNHIRALGGGGWESF